MAKLFYVIGASGVGKDTLINYARNKLTDSNEKIVFLHRYITRPANAGGENHVALSEAEFELRRQNGFFIMSWDSHGYRYGIGKEAQIFLENGFSVVVNGSREYAEIATNSFPELVPVLITVNEDELAERLYGRNRETPEEIKKRLIRAKQYNQLKLPNLQMIDNSDWNDKAGNELIEILS